MRYITVVALVAAGMLGVFLTKERRRSAELEGEISKLRQSAGTFEGQLAKLQSERDALRQAQGLPPAAPVVLPKPVPAAAEPSHEPAASNDSARLLEERTSELAEARKANEGLEAQVKQLEARVQALTQDAERLAAGEKQLREQMESATARAASLEAELKARDERLQKAELSIRDLRQQTDDRGRRSAVLTKISDDFDDLNRRRDQYMTNVLRRYREVTDLYRTLSLRQEGPRDDLSRIQNAISLAEEDMRQLQSLNAQARRLQRDLQAAK